LWNLGESHPVMNSLARSPLAIEIDEPLFLCHAQGLTGVVVTPKELCLSSVLESHPRKRNSRLSQYLLQGCMSWSNCIHTNYLFFTSSSTSYMMATSKPTYLLKLVGRVGVAPTTSWSQTKRLTPRLTSV